MKNDFNADNLSIILNYSYDEEINHLEEEIGEELPEDLAQAIAFCEENDLTSHIAYNLMLLKQELQQK